MKQSITNDLTSDSISSVLLTLFTFDFDRAPLLQLVSELYRVPGLILSISMAMKSQAVVDYAAIGCFLLMLATKVCMLKLTPDFLASFETLACL